jgi:DNA-directed RNA polymerase
MVDLVEALRPGLLDREMDRKEAGLRKRGKKLRARDRRNRHNMLLEDIQFARGIGSRHFQMRHRCDFRGRVYQVPYLNMQREDHVRCLFKFANGKKLSSRNVGGFTDHEMLEIHCANCAGEDKRPWEGRLQWVKENRSFIEAIADDPIATQTKWQDFDAPFCFVAACRELVSAWNDPNFVSYLPVFFDGTANGYQHLGALVRDREPPRKSTWSATKGPTFTSGLPMPSSSSLRTPPASTPIAGGRNMRLLT